MEGRREPRDQLVAQGVRAPRFSVRDRDRDRMMLAVPFHRLPTRFPYALLISQAVTKAVLTERLADVLAEGPGGLLDAYAARQRPMAEDVLSLAAGLTRLATLPPAGRPVRDVLLRVLGALPPVRQRIALRLSGLSHREPEPVAPVGTSNVAGLGAAG